MEKEDFYGVIVYEIIQSSGQLILNGTYTNNGEGKNSLDLAYMVNNEIAKKSNRDIQGDILTGTYTSRYIDATLVECTLIIKIIAEAYDLRWIKDGKELFKGIGLRVGKHLSVSYIKGEHLQGR